MNKGWEGYKNSEKLCCNRFEKGKKFCSEYYILLLQNPKSSPVSLIITGFKFVVFDNHAGLRGSFSKKSENG